MGLELLKPRQLPPVARVETAYLDMKGQPTKPERAVRVITREFDATGNCIRTLVTIDPGRAILL